MKTIDRETVQRILDTANIVEVVSDFVHLRRRGANYIGLCPFHSERTPSFSVSPSRGICKCFIQPFCSLSSLLRRQFRSESAIYFYRRL